ncbi:uncharacterized protein VICG_00775 [Vittaforma corneae ATCC 50505]|uniref:Uncharacterized protein n=1 Tax=Vittaforma corneae (strain ATCC 50505) TaxID=993615 RepID=L2GNF8_VITCO|nr:uncharacterized protein VICG_00775 [Vittaforma corneae ATCC 50505]ELA42134.1 hypothetical protein VICG_00775 [Vittaforma corneae ATCC 50505]
MINRLIIRNQNIVELPKQLKIYFDNRELTVEFHKQSLLRIHPHLFCAVIDNCVTFHEEEMAVNEENYRISKEEYEKTLLKFLKCYITTKKQQVDTKMDLVRLYFAINDVKKAFEVLEQMKPTGNVKMIRFISKTIESSNIKQSKSRDKVKNVMCEQKDTHREFIEICKEIDYHSAYILAFEVLSSFDAQSLFRLYDDLKNIYLEKTLPQVQCLKLSIKHSTKEHTMYDLSVFLMIKIAVEFTTRNQLKMAGSMLIKAAKMVYNTIDRYLVEELLSLAFILLNIDQKLFEETLECGDEAEFNLTAAQKFYIGSRFKMESQKSVINLNSNMDRCHSFLNNIVQRISNTELCKINIDSYTSIFKLDVVKENIQGVFTDRIKISVKTHKHIDISVMGVVDTAGAFYQCEKNTFSSNNDIEGKYIVLSDGQQIMHEFKMRRIEKTTDIILLDVKTLKGSEIKSLKSFEDINSKIDEQSEYRIIKFEFKVGKRCNYSFKNSIYQEVKDNFLYVFVTVEHRQIESNIEINEGIYETRYYHI